MPKTPKIQFVITNDDLKNTMNLISKLIHFYYKNKNKILVLFDSQSECELLDEILWSYDEISFTPHNIYNKANLSLAPVLISYKDLIPPISRYNMLINFSDIVLNQYSRFTEISEIVMPDANRKIVSRNHYKFYKNCGLEVTTENLEKILEINQLIEEREYEPN